MSLPESESASRRTESSWLSRLWGGPFVMGVLLGLLGVVALGSLVWTSLASAVFFGVVLLVAGCVEIGHAVRIRKSQGPFLLFLLGGLLSVGVGLVALLSPGAALLSITLLMIGYFCASGLFRTITAATDQYIGWGWDLAFGLMSLALGFILFAQLPASSLWALGLVVGVEILTRGITLMAGALAVRRVLREGPRMME